MDGGSRTGQDNEPRNSLESQLHGTIIVPSHIPGSNSGTSVSGNTKDASSINLVVGKSCFKKDKEGKKQDDEVTTVDDTKELHESNLEMTDFLTAW